MVIGVYPLMGGAESAARIELNLPGVDEETQNLQTKMLNLNAARKRQEAIAVAEAIVERVSASGGSPIEPMLNLSLLQAAAGGLAAGLDTVEQTIDILGGSGEENVALVRPLAVKGLLHRLAGQFDESESALRRAQHLLHRFDGVYTSKQRDILDQLTLLGMARRNYDDAVREQTYAYRVNALAYGADSLELLPYTYKYAAFLSDLGHFGDSVRLLQDALQRLSEVYGEDDLRLIKPLRAIADIRVLEREVARYGIAVAEKNPETKWIRDAVGRRFIYAGKRRKIAGDVAPPVRIENRLPPGLRASNPSPEETQLIGTPRESVLLDPSTPHTNYVGIIDSRPYRSKTIQPRIRDGTESLERVVDILNNDPAADVTDIIRSLVALGDMHLISGSGKAFEIYRQAWDQILESPNPTVLQSELFGSATRVQPKTLLPLPLESGRSDSRYAVDALVSVSAKGKITDIQILEAGVSSKATHQLKRRLYLFRYRPRMANGEFVATDSLALTQVYYGTRRKRRN